MSSHRLNSWQPENNYRFTDLNRPKPQVYNARFLYHDGAHNGARYKSDHSHWHRRTSRNFMLGSGLERHRVSPASDFQSQFPTPLPRSAIIGYDDNIRKDISLTPQAPKTTASIHLPG